MSQGREIALIEAVRARPQLWDPKHEHYYNKDRNARTWEEVGKQNSCSAPAAKKRWRTLRDTYRRKLKQQQMDEEFGEAKEVLSEWRFCQPMSFLDMVAAKGRPAAAYHNTTLVPQMVVVKDELHSDDDADEESMELGPQADWLQPTASLQRQEEEVRDSDYHFVMSLLPTLRAIPTRRKNQVRTKILQLLCEEETISETAE